MPRSLQHDRQLFIVTLALCLAGAVMVFSASAVTLREEGHSGYAFLLRQLLWAAIGMAGMFWLMRTDYRKLRQPRVIFTAISITLVLLIAVFFLDRSHATHRWVRLGPLSFQPSEIAKLVMIVYLVPRNTLRTARAGRQ
jgi:cell division protein FtsW